MQILELGTERQPPKAWHPTDLPSEPAFGAPDGQVFTAGGVEHRTSVVGTAVGRRVEQLIRRSVFGNVHPVELAHR
jgi:hypothetical protein